MLTNKLHHINIRAGGLVAAFAFTLTSFVPQYSYSQDALEEIIVTARKREENLQEIPLSVSAFTEEALEERGITSLQDIADFTPGFDFADAFGRAGFRPVIRGQSNIQGRANAGLFLEGRIIEQNPGNASASVNATVPLAALERVEVVKGPQSALYGRSTLAGAVNYVLKKPGDEFQGEITAEYGERDHVRVELHASGPIGETAGLALTLAHHERGGEWDNHYPGNVLGQPEFENKVGSEETDSLTAVMTFNPNERISLQGHLMYAATDDGHFAIATQPATANNCYRVPTDTAQPTPPAGTPAAGIEGIGNPGYGGSGYYCGRVDIDDVLAYNDGKTKLETDFFNDPGLESNSMRLGLRADIDLTEAVTFTSMTGYADVETESRWDSSYGTEDLIFFRRFVRVGFLDADDTGFDDFSQELRLSFDGGNALRSMLGFYYYKSDFEQLDGGAATFSTAIKDEGEPSTLAVQESTESWSVFGSVEFDLMEKITVGAAIRYNEDDIDKGATDTIKRSYDAILPNFTASYKATDDFMLYANIGKGNKPGDVNVNGNLPESEILVDEETAWNFEVGVKSAWMDNRIFANVSGYYIDWTDQQLTSNRFINNETFSILENIGESTVKGIELDLTAQLTDFWEMRIAYAWTDAQIDELLYSLDPGATSAPNLSFKEPALIFGYNADGNVLVSGNQLPQTSKHQLNLSSSFHGNMTSDMSWFLRGDFNYNSKRYAQVYNLAHTGGREIVNLRGGIKSGSFDIEVWVDNLFDNETSPALLRYAEFGAFFSTTRVISATLPEKRRVGVTARYRF